jgi:hypothetical protein
VAPWEGWTNTVTPDIGARTWYQKPDTDYAKDMPYDEGIDTSVKRVAAWRGKVISAHEWGKDRFATADEKKRERWAKADEAEALVRLNEAGEEFRAAEIDYNEALAKVKNPRRYIDPMTAAVYGDVDGC